jgi:hypothetical protein
MSLKYLLGAYVSSCSIALGLYTAVNVKGGNPMINFIKGAGLGAAFSISTPVSFVLFKMVPIEQVKSDESRKGGLLNIVKYGTPSPYSYDGKYYTGYTPPNGSYFGDYKSPKEIADKIQKVKERIKELESELEKNN